MKLNKQFFKPRKNLKNRVIKKMPFTVRGYQYYYGAIILLVFLIGFSQVFLNKIFCISNFESKSSLFLLKISLKNCIIYIVKSKC